MCIRFTYTACLFLFIADQYSIVWMYHVLFFYLPFEGRMDDYGEKKKPALTIYIQVLAWNPVSISSELIPRSEIAGSYGTYMFNFMRNCRAIFRSDCIVFNSHQQCMSTPDVLHFCQNLVVLFSPLLSRMGGIT